MSQEHDVWNHLYTRGSITAMEALRLYSCFRLAARIENMRKQGVNITTIMIEDNGKKFAKYVLEK